eukprot:74308-Pelagomonas_calceolata.AAC.5
MPGDPAQAHHRPAQVQTGGFRVLCVAQVTLCEIGVQSIHKPLHRHNINQHRRRQKAQSFERGLCIFKGAPGAGGPSASTPNPPLQAQAEGSESAHCRGSAAWNWSSKD